MYNRVNKEKLDFWHKTLGILASLIKIGGFIFAFGVAYFSANHFIASESKKAQQDNQIE